MLHKYIKASRTSNINVKTVNLASRLQPSSLTSLTNRQLYRTAYNTTFGSPFRLTFLHKESPFRSESSAAGMTDEAFIVPLAAESSDDNVFEDWLFAAEASRCCASGMAAETPCESVLFDEWGFL